MNTGAVALRPKSTAGFRMDASRRFGIDGSLWPGSMRNWRKTIFVLRLAAWESTLAGIASSSLVAVAALKGDMSHREKTLAATRNQNGSSDLGCAGDFKRTPTTHISHIMIVILDCGPKTIGGQKCGRSSVGSIHLRISIYDE